ncbi:MAG: OmpA family protein [Magnetovibrio sp.]|nr:OmpA family protein [Magnetovibrio sp.]
MQNRRLETTRVLSPGYGGYNLRPGLKLSVLVLALGLILGTSPAALAQDVNPVVDLSDPYVSVDLSVLNDGGLAPRLGAPMSANLTSGLAGGASYQAPGLQMPVSTLYIKPTSGFRLPPQTKAIEAFQTRAQMAKADMAPVAPPPTAAVEAVTIETVLEAVSAPVEVAKVPAPPPAPEPAQVPVQAAAPIAAPEVAAIPSPPPPPQMSATPPVSEGPSVPVSEQPTQPESAPVALDANATQTPPPAAMPAPVVSSIEETAALSPPKVDVAAPPPPPQAMPAQVEQAKVQSRPQSTPKAKASETVLPLPPKDEVASLPPATTALSDGDSMRIVFDADSSKMPQSARETLLIMANNMRGRDSLRLQLLAYAGNADTSASAARRLSLSRALAVRSFLIENGVRSTRIDVRALGNKSTEEITERVDITVVER